MRLGGTIRGRAGLWFFVGWNFLVLAAIIFCVIKLSGVVRGMTLLTFGIVGYAFVGLGWGAWLAGRLGSARRP